MFDWIQDSLFLLDILLNFVTGYYDNENNLVLDFKPIIQRYICSWFMLDFIALFPFDSIMI